MYKYLGDQCVCIIAKMFVVLSFLVLAVLKVEAQGSECASQYQGTCQNDTIICTDGSYVSGLCPGVADVRCCRQNDWKCLAEEGTCQTDTISCDGEYVSGKCSGPAARRCCLPPISQCVSQYQGTCQNDTITCTDGSYVSGLCPGAADIRCCKQNDWECLAEEGSCQTDTISCDGQYVSGKCSGPAARRCCLPPSQCASKYQGTCQNDTITCTDGSYVSGLCPGVADIRCCRQNDWECLAEEGTCQNDTISCDGEYVSGKCSGPAARRCCLPPISQCASQYQGTCQNDAITCTDGSYLSGLCPGVADIRCCRDNDWACLAVDGTCQTDTISCDGGYVSGKCSGPASRKCCLPPSCSNVILVSRREWGARDPVATSTLQVPVSKFFIHHTAGGECSDLATCSAKVKAIQNYHMDSNGWDDIGYSFLVGGDGRVYVGRGWDTVGAHTYGHNTDSLAAAMIGTFTSTLPTEQALTAAKNLIACGVEFGKITANYSLLGHRDAGQTACPGDALYAEIQTWCSHDNPCSGTTQSSCQVHCILLGFLFVLFSF